ncbi:restriction endonuclease subunit S [Myroides odoratus]|uniref:restriction endonuclease subunit S n=1 Tax=Myroides odoratus TaxID=256 RepID=UPI000DFFF3CD|nr:restriction endonuclease subunit S [Myroides odoratus]STZ31654.1 Type I restriction enzyme specificity protein MG438 [Myroides odoratus]
MRFPEFEGEWETKKLREFGEINPKYKKFPSLFVYIDLESVSNGRLLKEEFINEKEAPSRAQRILEKGDILFQMVRPYQKNNLFFNKEGRYVASTGYAQIRTKQNPQFVFQYLHNQKFVDKVIERCTGTSYPAINSSDLGNIHIHYPHLNEQSKIASFLSLVDERIQTQNKIIEELETLKTSISKKIFSQNLRFKDNNGNEFSRWEFKEIGDVFTITRGNVLSMSLLSNDKDNENNYPVYSSQTKNKGLAGYYNNFIFENAITWTTDGANAGDVNYREGKFYCTNVCGVLLNSNGNANHCIAELINSVSHKYVSYVGNPKLMNGTMSSIVIPFPSIQEQQKISNILVSLNTKIDIENTFLQKLDNQKKYLLDNLFV